MKVLVVDRVQLFQKIIASALENTGIAYEFADTGAAALAKLKKDKYEIVCISMYLDDMDAVELSNATRKLKSYAYTPIILITSEDNSEVISSAMKSGITDVFEKKDAEQLVNFVRRFANQNRKALGRVLYIEDTLSQRLLVTEMLKMNGLEVDGFSTGEEAFAAFEKKNYDLVITDIVLDGSMSGVTLANKIRRLDGNKGDVPILAVTAFDNISRRIGLFYLGINDYVIKPVVEEELMARIKSLITNRHFFLQMENEKTQAIRENSSKSEFLSLMSHELRTPLNSILGNLQLMQMDLPVEKVSDDFVGCLDDASSASQYLLELVNEVLDLAKIEAGNIELNLSKFSSKEFVQTTTNFIKHAAAEKELILHEHFEENIPDIYTDKARLKQVLINLLSNAVKYNQNKGDIFISIRFRQELGVISINVKDTGIGLSKADCLTIFDKFSRVGDTTSVVEGTGLGLYVTKKMVNEMGGELSVKSKLGEGSIFSVQLPIAGK